MLAVLRPTFKLYLKPAMPRAKAAITNNAQKTITTPTIRTMFFTVMAL